MASTTKVAKPLPKTILNTDRLTGEYLRPDLPRYVMHDYDPTRLPHLRLPIPLRMHCHTPDAGARTADRLGSPMLHPEMQRYDAKFQRLQKKLWHHWYLSPAIIAALRQHAESVRPQFSHDELTVVLLAVRDREYLGDHTPYWVEQRVARVTRYVRAHLLPDSRRSSAAA